MDFIRPTGSVPTRRETANCAIAKWLRQQLTNLEFRILSIRRIIFEPSNSAFSINNGDRIPIENRRSYAAPSAHFKRFYQKGSGPPAPKSIDLYCRSPSDRILPFPRNCPCKPHLSCWHNKTYDIKTVCPIRGKSLLSHPRSIGHSRFAAYLRGSAMHVPRRRFYEQESRRSDPRSSILCPWL